MSLLIFHERVKECNIKRMKHTAPASSLDESTSRVDDAEDSVGVVKDSHISGIGVHDGALQGGGVVGCMAKWVIAQTMTVQLGPL